MGARSSRRAWLPGAPPRQPARRRVGGWRRSVAGRRKAPPRSRSAPPRRRSGRKAPLRSRSAPPRSRFRPRTNSTANICYTIEDELYGALTYVILLTIEEEIYSALTYVYILNSRGRALPCALTHVIVLIIKDQLYRVLTHVHSPLREAETPENGIPAWRPKRGRSADRGIRPGARFGRVEGGRLRAKNGQNAYSYSVSASPSISRAWQKRFAFFETSIAGAVAL